MKENVVDFEIEYYLNKQKEAQEKLLNHEFEEVINLLKEPCEKIDEVYESDIYCPQNIFETAICLNYLGKEVHQNNLSKINFYDFYLMMASANYNLNNYEIARDYYRKAIKLDPASCIARYFEMEIDFKLNYYDDFISNAKDALYFAYTRPDMAKIYKLVGDYLRHEKDYEMAIVAYHLSIVYDLNDEVAKIVQDTAKEGKIDIEKEDWLSESYMNKFFNTYKIPLMPNELLYNLAKAMGDDAYGKKHYGAAKLGYKIAYELMLDEELKPILDEIEKNS